MSETKEAKVSASKNSRNEATVVDRLEREGLLAGWILASTDTVEGAIEGFFDVAQDIRGEVFQGTVRAIDFIEEIQLGGTRLMKGTATRISQFSQQSLVQLQSGSVGLVRVIRDTAQGATRLAAETTASFTSKNREVTVRAA